MMGDFMKVSGKPVHSPGSVDYSAIHKHLFDTYLYLKLASKDKDG
jgi:hypothetical protein